ncbi:YlmH/Sll1252 family protein [Clostridium sp.]|uniref:YlmH family RNA-binding protein n=1 Tax=Clostridium sp. TaxID=1506 RepID=UPI001A5CD77D|nr:YlmH/Sll1252 family protein [Clostridium sp.]MBK5241280.1 RNA-binding protein [Clostridium sp.]
MDKRKFLNSINCDDKNLISSIFNKMQLAEKTNKIVFTSDFISPAIWNEILAKCEDYKVKAFTNGIFKDADRRILAFAALDEPREYPINLLEIKNKSKFRSPAHKDYLGAIMSLGINREKLGDLIIEDGICYATVCSEISNYIITNLESIANCPCEVREYDYMHHNLPERKFEEKIVISTSCRLDGLVAAICNVSRNNSVGLISQGKILLNYFQCFKKDETLKNNDTLTIRGYGKFKIREIVGTTQKERLKIAILKYI